MDVGRSAGSTYHGTRRVLGSDALPRRALEAPDGHSVGSKTTRGERETTLPSRPSSGSGPGEMVPRTPWWTKHLPSQPLITDPCHKRRVWEGPLLGYPHFLKCLGDTVQTTSTTPSVTGPFRE